MSHERRVARFYAHGVDQYGSFHDNYLNFGLWSPGTQCFVDAAESLLSKVAEEVALSSHTALLDVACGMGTQDRFFARRFGCRTIQAMDLLTQHIRVAKSETRTPTSPIRWETPAGFPSATGCSPASSRSRGSCTSTREGTSSARRFAS